LLEADSGEAYLVDAGAPVLDILVNAGYDLTKLKAVFITHLHGDHMNGLHDIINLAAYYNIRCTIWLSEQRGSMRLRCIRTCRYRTATAAELRSGSSRKGISMTMAYCGGKVYRRSIWRVPVTDSFWKRMGKRCISPGTCTRLCGISRHSCTRSKRI
ncbi:MAG: MBL fold metallo-hydrolase, partial [Clostridia bacterium]|nr:MBL fold metallo-hydrolase [Clostridia bacterium]